MRSGFFNSEIIGYDAENMPVFDRAEDASFFAKYFSQFISNGVFPNSSTNMQVLQIEGMNVKVDEGECYINGYMGWVAPAEILEIEESDVQSRIDRIVARLDFTTKDIHLVVKKGTPLGNPVPPDLQRDYDIYEIGLADVRVNANVIEITQENITDLRLNTELCGIVANQLQHVDTTTLFNQYQDWLRRVTGQAEIDLETLKENFTRDLEQFRNNFTVWFDSFKNTANTEFYEWFNTIKDVLDGDTAGHLLNLINEKASSNDMSKLREDVNEAINEAKTMCIPLSFPVDNWVQNAATEKYEYIVSNDNIHTNTKIDIIFDELSLDVIEANIYEKQGSLQDGSFILVTTEKPTVELNANMYIEEVSI